MNDLHVVALLYDLKTIDTLSFDSPPPIDAETNFFRLRLQDGVARFELKQHFASAEEARKAIEEFLSAWEIDAAPRYGRREIRFVYKDAEIIDRNPPPPGSVHLFAKSISAGVAMGVSATLHATRTQYPDPPKHFSITPDVKTLWDRYEGHLEGREPLLDMAYFCLTVIKAANSYRIDKKVLNKLGELSSTRGDEKTARKVIPQNKRSPLTPPEGKWIHEALKAIIRHVGETQQNPSLPILTMSDLPKL